MASNGHGNSVAQFVLGCNAQAEYGVKMRHVVVRLLASHTPAHLYANRMTYARKDLFSL